MWEKRSAAPTRLYDFQLLDLEVSQCNPTNKVWKSRQYRIHFHYRLSFPPVPPFSSSIANTKNDTGILSWIQSFLRLQIALTTIIDSTTPSGKQKRIVASWQRWDQNENTIVKKCRWQPSWFHWNKKFETHAMPFCRLSVLNYSTQNQISIKLNLIGITWPKHRILPAFCLEMNFFIGWALIICRKNYNMFWRAMCNQTPQPNFSTRLARDSCESLTVKSLADISLCFRSEQKLDKNFWPNQNIPRKGRFWECLLENIFSTSEVGISPATFATCLFDCCWWSGLLPQPAIDSLYSRMQSTIQGKTVDSSFISWDFFEKTLYQRS